jgi:hypothetical protein
MKPHAAVPGSAFSMYGACSTRGCSRREFLWSATAGGCGLCGFSWRGLAGQEAACGPSSLISPGCRKSKVRIARIYLGKPKAHWPTPKMDLSDERARYERYFEKHHEVYRDVDFTVNELVSEKAELAKLVDRLNDADGILLIHLSMGVKEIVDEILARKRPTAIFAAPYSGHEWAQFGALRGQPAGELLECFLTSDLAQLEVAVRPFRAIHHLREARILNLSTSPPDVERVNGFARRFGTEIRTIELPRVLEAYEQVSDREAEAETRRWIWRAEKVVEPRRGEIYKSCRLALAFQRILDDEKATALTVDCYGSMYRKLPAFPCLGFVRLNNLGFAGICESDLTSAMTFILLQGLSGRPGFISDPTMDESSGSIILAHCLGTMKMDGPAGRAAPYQLRTIMERQEGCVPQVRMRKGQAVTQAVLVGLDQVTYFTGEIIDTPQTDRGCRTKITVKVDGDATRLWQHWAHGLHRVTCYGNIGADLQRFCRYKDLKLVNEATLPA